MRFLIICCLLARQLMLATTACEVCVYVEEVPLLQDLKCTGFYAALNRMVQVL